jgi:hypothetical protein
MPRICLMTFCLRKVHISLLDDDPFSPAAAVFFFFDYEEYADARGLSVYWDIDRKNAILDGDHEELVVILKTSLSNEASSAAATA